MCDSGNNPGNERGSYPMNKWDRGGSTAASGTLVPVLEATRASTSASLRLSGIAKDSIVDGPGLRLTVFSQGCPHRCLGCHNPQTHAYHGGTITSVDDIMKMVRGNPLLDGVTLSGGEPFDQAEAFAELAVRVKSLELGLTIMTYTGYTYEAIIAGIRRKKGWYSLLTNTDYLVDGPFILERRSLQLAFRGSTNQRIIDVARSLQEGAVATVDW